MDWSKNENQVVFFTPNWIPSSLLNLNIEKVLFIFFIISFPFHWFEFEAGLFVAWLFQRFNSLYSIYIEKLIRFRNITATMYFFLIFWKTVKRGEDSTLEMIIDLSQYSSKSVDLRFCFMNDVCLINLT